MRCNYCGNENQRPSKYCERCGRPLPVRNPQHRPSSSGQRRPTAGQNGRHISGGQRRPTNGHQSRSNGNGQNRPTNSRSVNGAPVRRQTPKKRTRWNPKFFLALGGILLVLILIPILIAIGVHRSDSLEPRRIQMFYSGAEGKTNVVFAGASFEKSIPGKVETTCSSADGLTQAVLTEGGELYCITPQKLSLVSSDVLDFVISANGQKIGYVIRTEPESTEPSTEEETKPEKKSGKNTKVEETTEATTQYVPAGGEQFLTYMKTSLFLYDVLDGSSPLVANDVQPTSVSLSPTGAMIGYSTMAKDSESFEGFMFGEGVATSLGRNTLPVASSDDGIHQYYLKYEIVDDTWLIKLFSKAGETEIKLGEFSDANHFICYLNQDFSEIVFSLSGMNGNFFAGIGSDKFKLSTGFSPLYAFGLREVQNGRSVISPLMSFKKTVFLNAAKKAQYIDNKWNTVDSGAGGDFFRIKPDGKTFYYMDGHGFLYSCNVRKMDKKEIASNVLNFDLSADGSIVYYVNTDNELHSLKGNKDTLNAENVYTSKKGMAVTDSGYLYFLCNYAYGSGTLCYIKGDGAIHALQDLDNVHDIAVDVGDYIYFRSNYGTITGTYDLFYGKGKKYKQLFSGIG